VAQVGELKGQGGEKDKGGYREQNNTNAFRREVI